MEDPEGSRPVELHAGVNLIRSFLWRKYWNISLWDGEDELEIRVPYTLKSDEWTGRAVAAHGHGQFPSKHAYPLRHNTAHAFSR